MFKPTKLMVTKPQWGRHHLLQTPPLPRLQITISACAFCATDYSSIPLVSSDQCRVESSVVVLRTVVVSAATNKLLLIFPAGKWCCIRALRPFYKFIQTLIAQLIITRGRAQWLLAVPGTEQHTSWYLPALLASECLLVWASVVVVVR